MGPGLLLLDVPMALRSSPSHWSQRNLEINVCGVCCSLWPVVIGDAGAGTLSWWRSRWGARVYVLVGVMLHRGRPAVPVDLSWCGTRWGQLAEHCLTSQLFDCQDSGEKYIF